MSASAIIIINGKPVMTSRLLFFAKAAKSRINYVIRFIKETEQET